MSKVFVIGAGAAGSMAAIAARQRGHEVTLFERNEKIGKKIYITGKGRCNLTNACDIEDLFENVVSNPKFLYSAFYTFTNDQVISFFEEHGMPVKVERGNRAFPVSDHSSDVIATLRRTLESLGVRIHYEERIQDLLCENGKITGVVLQNQKKLYADAVILATGGLSYPSTGSEGDGIRFAKKLGHTIKEMSPSLVPIETKEDYVKEMQGLSLRNVSILVKDAKGKKLYEDFGEMLFTHFGVSGPLILSASARLNEKIRKEELQILIDLKPALSEKQLHDRILREFDENKNKQIGNVLAKLLPAKMIPVMIEVCGFSTEDRVNEFTKEKRQRLVDRMKAFPITTCGLRSFKEAIVTRGGVDVKEVDASTMESKLISGLYFAGEMLDLDAVTGGFNLQIAWSTGYLAGLSVE